LTHVDGHPLITSQTHTRHLGDVARRLHVRGIASCTEDDGNLGIRVDVVGRDKGTGRVVDQSQELSIDVLADQLELYWQDVSS
jgi:hypothetical protein